MPRIKRYVIGDFEAANGKYALVFAKTKEEAIEKVKSINVGDKIDCYANHEHVITENDIKTLEDNPINFGKIVELKSDVFILTNE